jgi:hypothetical protein
VKIIIIFLSSLILLISYAFGTDKITEQKIRQIFERTDLTEYATSELKEKGYLFSVTNLVDENPETCWATHINGGIGEEILIFFMPVHSGEMVPEKWQTGIAIFNGFSKSKDLYNANNRLKNIDIKLYRIIFDGGALNAKEFPRGLFVKDLKLIEQTNTTLKDEYLLDDKIYFSTDLKEDYNNNNAGGDFGYFCALTLTVKSVYRGTKFNDLCVSEISFLTNADTGAGTDGGATN